jgi:tetratricopeptide (TPR) repeat protein
MVSSEQDQQHENSQAFLQIMKQIVNESNATKQLRLILFALKLLNKEKQPYLWGWVHGIAGDAFLNLHDYNRANNLEQAIAHYQQALEVTIRQVFPKWLAET